MFSKSTQKGKALPKIAAACVAALIALSIVGSALVVGDRLSNANALLGTAYYVVLVVLIAVGIVYPMASVAMRPVFCLYRLQDERGRANKAWCRRFVACIENADVISPEQQRYARACLESGDQAGTLLASFFVDTFTPAIDAETKKGARKAFLATAVSQSPLVDAVTMLTVGFNVVKAIVEACGFRPSNVALVKLYLRVLGGALIAGGLEEMDIDELMAGLLGGGSGAHVSGALIASAVQGMTNAFLVFRIGTMTKAYICADEGPLTSQEMRRGSYKAAMDHMKESGFVREVLALVKEKASETTDAAAAALKKAVAQAGDTAYDAASRAASSVVDAVAGRLRKAGQ